MGKVHIIVVGSKGEVKPVTVKQGKISKIKWLPEVEGEKIVISFRGDVPFSDEDEEWADHAASGTKVVGILKEHDKGRKHPYFYDAEGWETMAVKEPPGPDATPDLIVDGGELIEARAETKKSKKAKKSKSKPKDTKKAKKGRRPRGAKKR